MLWKNLGVIFDGHHAQLPTLSLKEKNIEILYSTKVDGKSKIMSIKTLQDAPWQVVQEPKLILDLGERGCFDDSGVMPSCIVQKGSERYLYYTGWNTDKGQVPYGHGIGLAIDRGSGFERISKGPIMDRCQDIPFLCNSPFVYYRDAGWEMWFCCGTGWDGDFPQYSLRSAFSEDGIYWCIGDDWLGGEGLAVSRPCVFREKVLAAVKTKDTPYRVQIFSDNGFQPLNIQRDDWDSDMACYPQIVELDGVPYMFYNGNGYGATGIGLAQLLTVV